MYPLPHAGLTKYDQEVYDRLMELFDQLPIAAIINSKFLCVHGGISTDLQSVPPIPYPDRRYRQA